MSLETSRNRCLKKSTKGFLSLRTRSLSESSSHSCQLAPASLLVERYTLTAQTRGVSVPFERCRVVYSLMDVTGKLRTWRERFDFVFHTIVQRYPT
jgi:hypothetical protein